MRGKGLHSRFPTSHLKSFDTLVIVKRTMVAMILCLTLVTQFAVSADARFVPDIRGTKCAKVGASRTVRKVPYVCTKSGRSSVWKAVTTAATTTAATTTAATTTTTAATTTTTAATTTTTVPVSKRISLIKTLPSYDFDSGWLPNINTPGFQYGHQVRPVIGQSFVFDRAMTLESLVFLVVGFTIVSDIDVYYRTPEPDNHALEKSSWLQPGLENFKVPMRLHLTLSKSRLATPLLNDIETTRDVVQLYTQTFDYVITARKPVELIFDTPVTVEPGTYLATIRLEALTEWAKREIVTIFVAGYHSGNASRGKYDRTAESNCNYTQGTDIYPNGRAYKAEHVENYVDWQSSPSRTIQTLLTEHRTKVQECIRIGNYSDIFNDGDLIMEWRGKWR